jgi:tetratricopeptide (TPR) repeat protein
MTSNRFETLIALLQQNPEDVFARYALALEYRNAGDLEQAIRELRSIQQRNPDYVAAYFHAGQALEKLGQTAQAAASYRLGVEAATRTGDAHAKNELQTALDILGL